MINGKRRTLIAPAIVLAGLAILSLVFADEFNPVRVAIFGRPDVIEERLDWKDALSRAGEPVLSMRPVDMTIYEYVDVHHGITTGEGYRFRFPKAYLINTLGGGTVLSLSLAFDFASRKPFFVVEREAMEQPGFSDERDVRNKKVVAVLSFSAGPRPDPRALIAARERGAGIFPERDPKRKRPLMPSYVYLGKTYAGLDMFDTDSAHPRSRKRQPYPFTEAIVFGRRNDNGDYGLVVQCSDRTNFSWCWVKEAYGPHTHLRISFSGTLMDQVDEVIARTRQLLDDHLVEHLPPREGWGKLD